MVVVSFTFPCYRPLVLVKSSFHHSLLPLPLSWATLEIFEQDEPVEVIILGNIAKGQSARVSEEGGRIHSQDQVLKVCSQMP